MYDIYYTEEARKKIKKLDKKIKQRIISTIERIRIRPHPHVKKLVANPYFSLRIGDYRVILDIKKDKLIILIITAGHRSKIYDKKIY